MNVKSSARIILPRKVDEDVTNLKVEKLSFLYNADTTLKANVLALQVQMLAVEEFSMKLLPHTETSGFKVVDDSFNISSAVACSMLSSSAKP